MTTTRPTARCARSSKTATAPPRSCGSAEVARPVIGDDDVLVEVRAAGLDRGTEHLMTGKPYADAARLRHPHARRTRCPAATSPAPSSTIGAAVTRFAPGDEVYGVAPGSFAEYAVAREARLARKPANLSFAQAAVVPVSAATALRALVDAGRVQPGQSVLVIGASGGVGSYAVQLAQGIRGRGHRRVQHREAGPGRRPSAPTTSSTTPATTSPTAPTGTTSSSTSPATLHSPDCVAH